MKKTLSFVLICILLFSALLLPSCSSKESPSETISSSEEKPPLENNDEKGNDSDNTPSEPIGSQGLEYLVSSDGRQCSITGIGTCTDTELVIPSLIDGIPVVEISPNAFQDNKEIVSVTIPNAIKTIGAAAFCDCTALKSITLQDGISQIGGKAFYNTAYYNDTDNWENHVLYIGNHLIDSNSGLKAEAYGESCDYEVKPGTKCIAYQALAFSGVTSVTIPGSVEYINERAFQDCSKLSTVSIAEGSVHLGQYLFYDCPLTSITLPSHVARIENYAFNNCTYYNTTSNWDNNVLYIGSHLIRAKNTPSSYSIRTGTTSIADYAFENCKDLKSISIPDTVTILGAYAFRNCSGLTSITLPESLTFIGENAFFSCDGISSLSIPKNVTNIEEGALDDIPSVSVSPENKTYSMVQGCLIDKKNKLLLLGSNTATIPNNGSVTTIAARAFSKCSELMSITVPNTIKHIGSYAFANCPNLSEIVLSDNVQYISDSLFENCPKLTSVTLSPQTKAIGCSAFAMCTSLESIHLPNSIQEIGVDAFIDCTSLTSITIPNGVTKIENFTFYTCEKMSYIVLPSNVKSIGEYAFGGVSPLYTIYYVGTENDWNELTVAETENSRFLSADRYFYSEHEPFDAGNYWRYVNGIPTKW